MAAESGLDGRLTITGAGQPADYLTDDEVLRQLEAEDDQVLRDVIEAARRLPAKPPSPGPPVWVLLLLVVACAVAITAGSALLLTSL